MVRPAGFALTDDLRRNQQTATKMEAKLDALANEFAEVRTALAAITTAVKDLPSSLALMIERSKGKEIPDEAAEEERREQYLPEPSLDSSEQESLENREVSEEEAKPEANPPEKTETEASRKDSAFVTVAEAELKSPTTAKEATAEALGRQEEVIVFKKLLEGSSMEKLQIGNIQGKKKGESVVEAQISDLGYDWEGRPPQKPPDSDRHTAAHQARTAAAKLETHGAPASGRRGKVVEGAQHLTARDGERQEQNGLGIFFLLMGLAQQGKEIKTKKEFCSLPAKRRKEKKIVDLLFNIEHQGPIEFHTTGSTGSGHTGGSDWDWVKGPKENGSIAKPELPEEDGEEVAEGNVLAREVNEQEEGHDGELSLRNFNNIGNESGEPPQILRLRGTVAKAPVVIENWRTQCMSFWSSQRRINLQRLRTGNDSLVALQSVVTTAKGRCQGVIWATDRGKTQRDDAHSLTPTPTFHHETTGDSEVAGTFIRQVDSAAEFHNTGHLTLEKSQGNVQRLWENNSGDLQVFTAFVMMSPRLGNEKEKGNLGGNHLVPPSLSQGQSSYGTYWLNVSAEWIVGFQSVDSPSDELNALGWRHEQKWRYQFDDHSIALEFFQGEAGSGRDNGLGKLRVLFLAVVDCTSGLLQRLRDHFQTANSMLTLGEGVSRLFQPLCINWNCSNDEEFWPNTLWYFLQLQQWEPGRSWVDHLGFCGKSFDEAPWEDVLTIKSQSPSFNLEDKVDFSAGGIVRPRKFSSRIVRTDPGMGLEGDILVHHRMNGPKVWRVF